MSQTYKAIIRGNQVEWLNGAPNLDDDLRVDITIPEQKSSRAGISDEERRRSLLDTLNKLVASGVAEKFGDPIEFQREARKDRPLPGRED